ncbi:MAG: PAS domain-containing protein [Deltaproteobacteria bacterium]|nr:PAS domain-containing protein [Deltaproteobacteria bacterium]
MKLRKTATAHHIALALAIVIPFFLSGSYFFIGYVNIDATLQTEAEANALFASQIIHANPDYWQFEQIRLQEFLSRRLIKTHNEIRRIVDLNNAMVAEHRDHLEYPFMMRSHDLYDSGRVVAKLEIIRSLRPLLWNTLLVGIVGYLLTLAIYWSVKIFILDRRQQAEESLLESEEKYRLLVSKLPALVFKGYADWVVDFFDDKIEALTGYSKAEFDSRRLKWSEVIQSEDLSSVKDAFIQALRTNQSYVREYRIKAKDGGTLWLQEKGQIIRHQDGKIDYISGVFFDITERKIFEEERLTFSKMESLGVLAGGIAHDFNNILTVILGNINLAMLDLPVEYGGQEILTEAEKACFQAQSLARQLLTFAKGGAPIKELVAIEPLIRESVTFACRGSAVRGEFTLPDNLWALEVDPGQINQVFRNLIINAIQAMPGGGTIKIQAENLVLAAESDLPLSPGKYVKISLQDQGGGMPAGYLAKIFDPYFTTKQKGSGLGLATSYFILKNHHGHIAVESKPRVGTTFTLYLPAVDQKISPSSEAKMKLYSGKGKILVMDDEDLVREVVGKMVAYLGYEANLARDGAEAISIFTEAQKSGQPFDAVILDLTVPGGMGGKETIENLLKIDPKVKAIASSGYSDDPVMAEFHKYGFSAIIPKPYRVMEAGKILHDIIANKEDAPG